jgi:hypothetical protein
MSCQRRMAEWTAVRRTHVPRLSPPQAPVLALWRVGMVLARACALTAVAVFWAGWCHRQEQPVRPQWRECGDEGEAKRGDQRQALALEPCCEPLLGWVLRGWQGTPVALALAAPTLGTRFTVLALSVVSRGGALPVAWTSLLATGPQAWRREWRRMRRQRRPARPRAGTVIVLAARGLSARWLVRRIVRWGWPPCVRLHRGGPVRPDPQATYRPVLSFVPQPGPCWRGTGPAFNSPPRRRRCPLLACGAAGDTDPWRLLTELPPETSAAGWSGRRAWIEPPVQGITRAGWQGQRTRMPQPARAARLGLAVAVATLGLLSVGGMAEEALPASTRLEGSAALAGQRRQRRATRLRLVSSLRRGWSTILVALLEQAPLPLGAVRPEPWPRVPGLAAHRVVLDPEVQHHVAA